MFTSDEPLPCSAEPELWFSNRIADIRTAKAACMDCPFQEACLRQTLETEKLMGHRMHGVHAGFTADERTKIEMKQSA